jgi:hypothetical protein
MCGTKARVKSEQIVERLKGVAAQGVCLLHFRLRCRHLRLPFKKEWGRYLMASESEQIYRFLGGFQKIRERDF